MGFPRRKKGLQGRWPQALLLFISPLLLIFVFRWLLYEPFVIPSESMMPNLMVHDHILVSKYSYGIKLPFGDGWIIRTSGPQRGDVVVFRYPLNRDVFFIKRLIALPGDKLTVQNGQISVNGVPWVIHNVTAGAFADEDRFTYFQETIPDSNQTPHLIRLAAGTQHIDPVEREFVVPAGAYFVMGDNRDQSQDSRFWGMVEEKFLVGRASVIWLSCESTMPTAPMICDPRQIRSERLFKKVGEL